MKISYLLTLTSIIYSINCKAQIFDIEQANPKVKWKQINTEEFQLIFPEKFSPTAKEVAKNISIQLQQANQNLSRKARKISIIAQGNSVEQNGFVQLAPRKSELYPTPSGIADNQAWLQNLSLHEMRHVAQFDNLTGNIRKPYGQQIAFGLFGLNLPSWYFEGDAVLHETLFSAGGRGRLSSWQMPIRANIQSNLHYDFNKYVHGSYKDLVPSYYTIGYFMNSELYQKDVDATGKIYDEMRGKLLRPFNFQRALQKNYGGKAKELFNNTVSNLKVRWDNKKQNTYPNRLIFDDKYPTNYILPQVENEAIYAIQISPQRVARIVKIEQNSRRQPTEITKLGVQLMPYFDLKKHIIVWDEYRRNTRFSLENFNVINVYNTVTKEKKTILHDTRYYTPTISPDLKTIAVVEVDEANNSYLTLIDILTEKKTKTIPIKGNIHIQQPTFNSQGDKIVCIAVSEKGTNLMEIGIENEEQELISTWSNHQIERPIYAGDNIIFKSNIDNKDDIFTLKNGHIYRITNTEFGGFNPFLSGDILYFNDYTPNGLKINSLNINNISTTTTKQKDIETLYSNQNDFIIPALIEDSSKTYTIQDYKELPNAFNFHSISISNNNFENFDNFKPGLYFLSNNVLNTTQATLGLEYDTNIKKTTYSAEISYQKYFPKITLGYKNRGLIGSAISNNQSNSISHFDYRENLVTIDVQVPFIQFNGNNVYAYGIYVGTSYQKRYDLSIQNLQNFNQEIAFPLNYQVYFNKNTRRSRMDIFPRWGQNISLIYRHLPFEKDLKGRSWALRTNFYFPGFALNHGFQLRYSMEKNTGRFSSSSSIPLFDGITYIPYKTIENTLLIDYRLPISYPDLSIGQLAYIKRIYAGVSANYLNIHKAEDLTPPVVSASLFFDFNVFKYTLPNFVLETKLNYITISNTKTHFTPTFSLSHNY